MAVTYKSYKSGAWSSNTGHALTHSQLVSAATDVVVIGDSWAAFGHHRGADVDSVHFDLDAWYGGVVNVSFWNVPLGMTSTANPNDPRIVGTHPLDGRKGFASPITGKGRFVEALERAGVDPDNINLHEYACGATTAGWYEGTPSAGAFNQGRPTQVDPTPGIGSSYGCPTGVITGGLHATDDRSVWLQKQYWLQDGAHASHPWRDWSLCDMIAHPPTGKVVVLMSLGGNDLFGLTQDSKFVDPMTGVFDPNGVFAARWEQIKTNVMQVVDSIYLLNPNAEVVWTGYCNFPVDDANLANPKIKLPTNYGPSPTTPSSYGPVGWNVYEDDGPNLPDPDYTGEYYDLDTLPLSFYPGGRNLLTLPFSWFPSSPGFMRLYGAWTPYTAQRDAGYVMIKHWVAHYFADKYSWQGQGTAAHPGFWSGYSWVNSLSSTQSYGHSIVHHEWWGSWTEWVILGYGPTRNYKWQTGDGSGGIVAGYWSLRSDLALYQGHRWDQIYARTLELLADSGTMNNIIFASNGDYISGHQLVTIITKDITTKNVTKVFRDYMRPQMQATASHYLGLGKRFIVADTFDIGPHDPGTSQDDPDAYPAMPTENFIEGVHLSSLGIDYWQDAIVSTLLSKTQVLGTYTPVPVVRKVRYGNNWL